MFTIEQIDEIHDRLGTTEQVPRVQRHALVNDAIESEP